MYRSFLPQLIVLVQLIRLIFSTWIPLGEIVSQFFRKISEAPKSYSYLYFLPPFSGCFFSSPSVLQPIDFLGEWRGLMYSLSLSLSPISSSSLKTDRYSPEAYLYFHTQNTAVRASFLSLLVEQNQSAPSE